MPGLGSWPIVRKSSRFLIDLRLLVRTSSYSDPLHGRTSNLSEGGLGGTIAGDISMGDIVELEFQMPGTERSLRIMAEVRYRQGFQYGFRFINAAPEQVEIIRRETKYLPLAPIRNG